jgi:hypothetical protein
MWQNDQVPRRLSTKPIPNTESKVVAFPKPLKAKNPMALALGLLGGSKGGRKRAQNLSPERRKAIAQQGAQARWAKARSNEGAEADASRREGSSNGG